MRDWIANLFHAIDAQDTTAFCTFLTDDCRFRFANLPEVEGKPDIERFVAGFFGSIAGLSHTLIDVWEHPEGVVCHGRVRYTRKNGSELSVPFANLLKTRGDAIHEYLIFADTSRLYSE